jgi:lipopolysaccharide biosynthesis glycosyltransferase
MLRFDGQQDGTNAFIYSRYLVPFLQDYKGWAIFCDGDMHVNADISELWDLRDDKYAVMVVKHDYKTKAKKKYVGSPLENDNIDYECKNWSSVMLFNCGHPSNKILTKRHVAESGPLIHRFNWLNDDDIGELPKTWNHLDTEYEWDESAKLVHQTLGTPAFAHYAACDSAHQWNAYLWNTLNVLGERPYNILHRATWNRDSEKAA